MPMFVAVNWTGDQEVPTVMHVFQKRLPSRLGQRLRGREDHQFRRAQHRNLVLSDGIQREVVMICQSAHRPALCFQLQITQDGELRCLRSDHRDGGLLGCVQMLVERRGKCRVSPHYGRFGLLRSVGPDQADGSFVALRHVRVRVPEPLDCACALHKGSGNLALEKGSLVLGIAPCYFVQIKFALQSSFLDEHGFSRLLGEERVPQHIIVLPPGMIRSEVDEFSPVRGRKTVLNAAFILAHGDELQGTSRAHRVSQASYPIGKYVLREDEEVVYLKRIASNVGTALGKFDVLGKGNRPLHFADGKIPCCR